MAKEGRSYGHGRRHRGQTAVYRYLVPQQQPLVPYTVNSSHTLKRWVISLVLRTTMQRGAFGSDARLWSRHEILIVRRSIRFERNLGRNLRTPIQGLGRDCKGQLEQIGWSGKLLEGSLLNSRRSRTHRSLRSVEFGDIHRQYWFHHKKDWIRGRPVTIARSLRPSLAW